MNPPDPLPTEQRDLLEDAIAAVRKIEIEDSLVDRCRHRATAIADAESSDSRLSKENRSKENRRARFFLLAAAASVLLLCNMLQAYARLPSSDRQFAAVHVGSDLRRHYVYSDLRLEPAPPHILD